MPANFSRKSESVMARMATASKAALWAPSMATVATGIPVGICTVASRESIPSREALSGTPITGSKDLAAITPAR